MFSYKHLRVENLFMNYLKLFFAVILTISISGFKNSNSNQNDFLITTKARIAVEKAWETYHDGALGGTLPSPAIQTDLEMKLHRCRALLAEAYDAEDKGNDVKAKQLILSLIHI